MMDEDVLARLRLVDPCPQQPDYDDADATRRIRAITSATDRRNGVPPRVSTMTAPRRRHGHRFAPVLAAAVVVAVVLGVLLAVHYSGSRDERAAQSTPSRGRTTQIAPIAQPSAVPAAPAGFTANEFRITSTEGREALGGGIPTPRPTCTLRQITAVAATRRTDDGVLGVIHLRGSIVNRTTTTPERCSLPIADGPSKLIGADGEPLSVPLSPGDVTNPPSNARPDLALNNGSVSWGFAWLGSHCGAPAAAIYMPLQHSHGSLHIELHGPQPRCTATTPTSRLIDGIAGSPGQPVQPPRPEYSTLRLTGHITPGTTTEQLAPINATLHTTGTAPVTLDPCPSYSGRDNATARSGGFSDPLTPGHLACDTRAITISPNHPLHWTIPATSLVQTPGTGAIPGSTVTVELDIAGVPPTEMSTTARR